MTTTTSAATATGTNNIYNNNNKKKTTILAEAAARTTMMTTNMAATAGNNNHVMKSTLNHSACLTIQRANRGRLHSFSLLETRHVALPRGRKVKKCCAMQQNSGMASSV